jgi:hypothetical protein
MRITHKLKARCGFFESLATDFLHMAGAEGRTNYKMAGTANGTFGYLPPFTTTTQLKERQHAVQKSAAGAG